MLLLSKVTKAGKSLELWLGMSMKNNRKILKKLKTEWNEQIALSNE